MIDSEFLGETHSTSDAPKEAIDISDAGSVLKPSFKKPTNAASTGSRPRRFQPREARASEPANDPQQRPRFERSRPRNARHQGQRQNRSSVRPNSRVRTSYPQQNGGEPITIREAAKDTFRIIPLGGSGETGDKNMLVFEYNNDILVIDAGVKFPSPDMLGVDYVICDTSYLEQNKHKIKAFLVTHGHEDHIGGFPYIWPKFPVPIYTAPLTAGLIKAKFEEHGVQGYEFRIIKPNEKFQIGAFTVEPVRMTHSIPDILGLAITTPAGLIFHATDWKIDFTPAFGEAIDFAKLSELAQRGVTCLLSDSTNVMEPGFTMSEQVVGKALEDIFTNAPGRIIVSSFSSRIDRIQHVVTACAKTGRKLALSGRSMEKNVNIALELGYLKVPQGVLVDIRNLGSLPDHKIAVMSTGSQGQENSALVRMAIGEHRHIKIKKGDTVVLSSSIVPGNEAYVEQTINNLYREGAEVITNKNLDIHSSGHANREEVKLLISMLKPKYLIPIHGDYRRFKEHCKIAVGVGMKEENCFIIENGQVVEFKENEGRLSDERVQVGQVLIDGIGVGDIGEIVLRDRQTMAKDGLFLIILTVDGKTGRLLSSPDIISRGFVYMKESEELINGARALARRMHSQATSRTPISWDNLKKALRDDMGDYLYNKTQRHPMVISAVIQV